MPRSRPYSYRVREYLWATDPQEPPTRRLIEVRVASRDDAPRYPYQECRWRRIHRLATRHLQRGTRFRLREKFEDRAGLHLAVGRSKPRARPAGAGQGLVPEAEVERCPARWRGIGGCAPGWRRGARQT